MSTDPGGSSGLRAALLWLRLRWDRAAEASLLTAAAVVLFLTYRSVSRTPFVADQLSYLASGGVAGLFLLAVGIRFRITGDLRDEWHKLDRIEAALFETELSRADEPLVVLPTNGADSDREPERERVGSQRGAVAVSAACVMSVALLLSGWWRTAHADAVSGAFAGFAVAVAAGVVLSAACCAPTVSLRRRLGQRKARLLGAFLTDPAQLTPAVANSARETVLFAPGLTRFHREGCPATAGLAVEWTDRNEAAASLLPCEICAAG